MAELGFHHTERIFSEFAGWETCPRVEDGQLELLPLADIYLHEEYDLKRVRPLAAAIAIDDLQRHPIVLGRTGNNSLVHLDGATRIQALKQLKCRHVAAQIVNYRDDSATSLRTWSHLTQLDYPTLQHVAKASPGCSLKKVDPDEAAEGLEWQRLTAVVAIADGDVFGLAYEASTTAKLELLKALLHSYGMPPKREVLSPINCVEPQSILQAYPSANAIVSFAAFSKDQVAETALAGGRLFPSGITRHVITCGRILHINVPLSLLRSPLPAEEKNQQLDGMLANRSKRVYQECTIQYEN